MPLFIAITSQGIFHMQKAFNLGVFCPSNTDATSFYRGIGPLGALRRQHHAPVNYIFLNEVNWSNIKLLDAVFMQRPFTRSHVQIVDLAKRQGLPVWIDYDDHLFTLPESNPCFDLYMNKQVHENIKQLLFIADVISVSTPALQAELFRLATPSKFRLIRNSFDDYMFSLTGPNSIYNANSYQAQPLIFWRGSETHFDDIDPMGEAIIRLAKKHPMWTWMFIGDSFMFTRYIKKQNCINIKKSLDIYDYMQLLSESHPAVQIVPLANTIFNACKSDCAFLEGSFVGASVLAPDFQNEFLADVCFKYPTAEDSARGFEFCLDQMLDMPLTELFAQRNKAWQYILDNRLLSKNSARSEILTYLQEIR